MGLFTVTRDDVLNLSRSYSIVGIAVATLLVSVGMFVTQADFYDDPYQSLFVTGRVLAFLLPVLLAPVTYLAIAGERSTGTIKFVMGLPNGRGEYFLGKFLSRSVVAAVAVVASVLGGLAVSLSMFANPPDVVRFIAFAGVTSAYAVAFVGLFVAISAAVGSRSRAMVGVFGVYFVLVPFWIGFTPVFNVEVLLNTILDVLPVAVSEDAKNLVLSLSPMVAYIEATKVVFADVLSNIDSLQAHAGETAIYRQWWFSLSVLVAWAVGSLLLGYAKFSRSELA